MEHRLVTGGNEFLPFARSCITKLKKLGLPYADQSYEVNGVSIKVRIEPGHEYIRIEGNDEDALYLVFFDPKIKINDAGNVIDYTVYTFFGSWTLEGTYIFVKTKPPECSKFKVVGKYVVEVTRAVSGPDNELTANGVSTSAEPLGFYRGKFAYLNRTSTSYGFNGQYDEDMSPPTDGSRFHLLKGEDTAGGDVMVGEKLFSLGRKSRNYVLSTLGYVKTYSEYDNVESYCNDGYMSGNIVRAKTISFTNIKSGVDIDQYTGSLSPGVIKNTVLKIPISVPGRAGIDMTNWNGGPTITLLGASYSQPYNPLHWDQFGDTSTTTVPPEITMKLEDNRAHRWRIALWYPSITLLDPSKIDPATGEKVMYPPTLEVGTILKTTGSASSVFSAFPSVTTTAKLSRYIYSYSGDFVCTVPPSPMDPWGQGVLLLYDKFMVQTNAYNGIALDSMGLQVFMFNTEKWVGRQLVISTEDDTTKTPKGEIPKSLIPPGSFFVGAYRDEANSLPKGK